MSDIQSGNKLSKICTRGQRSPTRSNGRWPRQSTLLLHATATSCESMPRGGNCRCATYRTWQRPHGWPHRGGISWLTRIWSSLVLLGWRDVPGDRVDGSRDGIEAARQWVFRRDVPWHTRWTGPVGG